MYTHTGPESDWNRADVETPNGFVNDGEEISGAPIWVNEFGLMSDTAPVCYRWCVVAACHN